MLTLHFLPPKQNLLYTPPSPNPNPKKNPQIQSTPTQISTMGYEASATPATALAPGFRFHPTDEELVRYYLKRKVCGKSFRFDAISEIDIYKSEPWDLPGKSKLKGRDLQWYFFSPLDKKYGNGSRMNRATGEGYWKATGNDRPIRHDFRNVGMKKTLVFHKGRAPGGKRTDWVMHEYRLVDEELEKAVYQKKDLEKASEDGYVLCRVFQKSGPGPRNGDQYALFFEDEWEDDRSVLVPGAEAVDERTAGDYARPEGTNLLQDTPQNKAPPHQTEHSRDSQNVPFVCKIERADDCLLPSMNGPEPFQIVGNKRLRQNDSDPSQTNGSESSTTATQDPCPLATTTATATETKTNLPSAPLELPLLESIENRESSPVPVQRYDAGTLNMSMPPGCMEFINNLQKEIHNISFERQTLKIEVMSAQAMINILQSRIEFLNKENEDLKRMIRD